MFEKLCEMILSLNNCRLLTLSGLTHLQCIHLSQQVIRMLYNLVRQLSCYTRLLFSQDLEPVLGVLCLVFYAWRKEKNKDTTLSDDVPIFYRHIAQRMMSSHDTKTQY